MQLNQNKTYNSQDNVDSEGKVVPVQAIESRHYLYPNGHRMTPQMRWFKGSRDRVLKPDIAA